MTYDEDYESEEDTGYISEDKARPKQIHFGSGSGTGHYQKFRCPSCGSYNTEQGTYYDKCNTCDWGVAYINHPSKIIINFKNQFKNK